MRTLVGIILIGWLGALSVLLFVPSFRLLFAHPRGNPIQIVAPPVPPQPPQAPTVSEEMKKEPKLVEELVKLYGQQVTAYTQQSSAYREQISAYKVYTDAAKNDVDGIYRLVVKETLIALASTFATALLGYAFVRGAALTLNNLLLQRSGQPAQRLDI